MSIKVVGMGLEGAAELREKLARISDDVRGPILRNAVQEGAEPILDEARRRAPVLKAPAPRRVAGLLRSLIKAWVSRSSRAGKVTMQIGVDLLELARFLPPGERKKGDAPDFLYPLYQEYGTKKDDEQPYLRPAIDSKTDAAVGRVTNVVRRNLRRYEERSGA